MKKDHTFTFNALEIADAARTESAYHGVRAGYWEGQLESAIATVKATASVNVREFEVTGGKRVDVVVDYGDPGAYQRMQEAQQKIKAHQEQRDRFEVDAELYGSQADDRIYELDSDDVFALRLTGRGREED